ncbi:glycoside hydrolase superfamily [Mycena sp. CBHHK59/15]|nr:glycoside hydrolase superfamily [Mycena sp. CBHHK59/15]
MVAQVKELCDAYAPEIWWFDGHWAFRTHASVDAIDEALAYILARTPEAQINDRTGHTPALVASKGDQDYMPPASTFRVYKDRAIPVVAPTVPWEHIGTVGNSWGRDRTQTKEVYKAGAELWEIEKKVEGMGGRVCWNLGPDADGGLDELEVASLMEVAKIRWAAAEPL